MAWNEDLPEWENAGVEPPSAKKTEGWQVSEKPPAGWFNWLFNRTYKAIKEIRDKLAPVATSGQYTDLTAVPLTFKPAGHKVGGPEHQADTLANLNAKISDATLDDKDSPRTPKAHGNEGHTVNYITDTQSHGLGSAYHTSATLAQVNAKISDANLDDKDSARTPKSHGNEAHSATYITDTKTHGFGSSYHSAGTLAQVNALISDANLDDKESARTPKSHGNEAHTSVFITDTKRHGLGSTTYHSAGTLAQLNALVTDATLDDVAGTRTPKSHGNEAHSATFTTTTQLAEMANTINNNAEALYARKNTAITGATKTKITYDSKGLVTAGADAEVADISGLQAALDAKTAKTYVDGAIQAAIQNSWNGVY